MIYLNDRFIGRRNEVAVLEEAYASRSFELVTVSGPSGSGKTALTREFCRGRRAVLYTAVSSNGQLNLSAFSKAVSKAMYKGLRSLVSFSSMTEAFLFLKKMSEKERLIIAIDAYDRLISSDPSVAGVLRDLFVRDMQNANVMVILTGPDRFMAEQSFGQEPRRIVLGNLSFSEVCDAYSGYYGANDLVMLYAATGGCPEYLRYADPSKGMSENIDMMYFRPDSPLFREVPSRFAAMVRNTEQYGCILSALASGPKQMGDIVDESGVSPSSACSTYLSALSDLGLVEKILPFGGRTSRKGMYCIRDSALRFWYRYVHQNRSLIEFRYEDDLSKSIIDDADSYLSRTFRDICIQFIAENGRYFDLSPSGFGEWWGDAGHIDIVVSDLITVMFCDCRYRDSPVGLSVLENLMSRAESVRTIGPRRFALFSREGFTDELLDYAEMHPEVTLVTLKDICRF